MSKARLVITAVVLEGRPAGQVCTQCGISKSWVYELLARYREEGDAAFEPRSRRPLTCPIATPPGIVDMIVRLRKELTEAGLDAGPATLVWHLKHHHQTRVSVATVARILTREGLITPTPKKRPKAPTSVSKPKCRTRHGNRTSPTIASPTAPTSKSSPGSTTTPATPCTALHRPHSSHCEDRPCDLPPHCPRTRPSRLHADRQRHGPTPSDSPAGRGGRTALESELARCTSAEKLTTQPPHDLRQGRAIPADAQEMATQPTPSTTQRRRTTDPHRPLRRRVQQPTPTQLTATPRNTSSDLPGPPQAIPSAERSRDNHNRVRHDRIDKDASSPCASTQKLHHIGMGRTLAEPPSSCSSTTSTSASSTPPSANYSENSPSTPPATTNQQAKTATHNGTKNKHRPTSEGSACPGSLERSHGVRGGT